jgi:hypothetical protein
MSPILSVISIAIISKVIIIIVVMSSKYISRNLVQQKNNLDIFIINELLLLINKVVSIMIVSLKLELSMSFFSTNSP